jgi:hypothetical protein
MLSIEKETISTLEHEEMQKILFVTTQGADLFKKRQKSVVKSQLYKSL